MSEKATDSPPASESAAPAPPAKGGKKLWVAIVAVIVVVALIVSAVLLGVFNGGEDGEVEDLFDAEMVPSTITVNAGKTVELTVDATWDDAPATASKLDFAWSCTNDSLGEFNLFAQKTVEFTAGTEEGNATIQCQVTYEYDSKHTFYANLSSPLRVNPPSIDSVVVVPSVRTMLVSDTQEFFAFAYNSVDIELPNATITWEVSGMNSADYDINATEGPSVIFTALALGSAILYANATDVTDPTGEASGSAVVNIVTELPERTAKIWWYDLFETPNEPFWDMRWAVTSLDEPLTDSYPYLYRWYGAQEGNTWIYSSMTMNVTGKNMSEVNMNSRPTFLPMLGNYRGGTADIRWYANYLNENELGRYPDFIGDQNDGWIWVLNGTVTLDKPAARTVLGIGSTDYDENFNAWWSDHSTEINGAFSDWWNYEGKVRIDIFNSYDYPFTLMYNTITAEKVGDKVVLSFDVLSWGLDVLLGMQMWDAGVLETWWYMEDMWFNATIGPEIMNLSLDAVVEYAAYAYETTLEGLPCWEWEALNQYVVPASPEHPRSDYTPYANLEYWSQAPGAGLYGAWMTYDYAPTAWNLSEGEELIIEWPAGNDEMFLVHDPGGDFFDTKPVYGAFEVRHTEPMNTLGQDMPPGQFEINNDTRQVIFRGPFDMWTWSKDQQHNENLRDEWDRLGILPYGIPTIELALRDDSPAEPTYLKIEGITNPVEMDTATEFTVRVLDQRYQPYPFYNGTVTFSSSDPLAGLPADYTFSNAGLATFYVSFNTRGYANLHVEDMANASIFGDMDIIEVGPIAESLVIENAPIGASSAIEFSMRVTAYDQFGHQFTNYSGTVQFTTTDSDPGVVLPADYTFVPADDAGSHRFKDGFALITPGSQDITVVDLADSALTDTVSLQVSETVPEKTYTISDMFEEPFGWWWTPRWTFYGTDIILANETGMHTWYFLPGKTDLYSGLIYAPYRYSIDAKNQSSLSIDTPVFMPTFGPEVEGASVELGIYFQYIDPTWWEAYWSPAWASLPGDIDVDWIYRTGADGYDLGTIYTVKMNREGAEQWMNMPVGADVDTWWAANNASYAAAWEAWIANQGNVVYDIFCGYEWTYDINGGTWAMLKEDEATGDVVLTVTHIALGYEILMTRWLSDKATSLSPLEPYFEDFQLNATYGKVVTNVSLNAVAQYSLHAVRANGTADAAAWAWEPARIDYITKLGHPSDYKPYVPYSYQSWNSGDTWLGQEVYYEQTPTWFNISANDKLIFQLPSSTVPGYKGIALTDAEIEAIITPGVNDMSAVYAIMDNGTLDLGYYVTGWPVGTGADLSTMYNSGTKTLTIDGPQAFNNLWHAAGGVLYHGVPWIEFNIVSGGKAASSAAPGLPSEPVAPSTSSELLSLVVVASATMMAVVALGSCVRRKN